VTKSIQSLSKNHTPPCSDREHQAHADRVVYGGKQCGEHKSAESRKRPPRIPLPGTAKPRYRNNIAIVLCGQPAARCNWAAVIVGRLTYGRNIEELSGALFLTMDGVNNFGGKYPIRALRQRYDRSNQLNWRNHVVDKNSARKALRRCVC